MTDDWIKHLIDAQKNQGEQLDRIEQTLTDLRVGVEHRVTKLEGKAKALEKKVSGWAALSGAITAALTSLGFWHAGK